MNSSKEPISDKDFFKYNTIEEFREKLNELKQIDFANKSFEEIGDVFYSYVSVIPTLIYNFDTDRFNDFLAYRVRMNIGEAEDLGLLSTYSYPNGIFCNTNGRANISQKSVFYASNSALTAIIECKPKINDLGYLGIWKGNTSRKIKAALLLPRNLTSNNEWYLMAQNAHQFMEQHFEKIEMNKESFVHELLRFICDLYLTEKEPYHLTSFISHELLYHSSDWRDLIIYPSFANKAFTCNLAFHPNTIDSCLSFIKVIRFKILDINNDNFKIGTGRVGELIDNKIIWRGIKEEETDFANLSII